MLIYSPPLVHRPKGVLLVPMTYDFCRPEYAEYFPVQLAKKLLFLSTISTSVPLPCNTSPMASIPHPPSPRSDVAGEFTSACDGGGHLQGSVPEVMSASGGEMDDVFVLRTDHEPTMTVAAT